MQRDIHRGKKKYREAYRGERRDTERHTNGKEEAQRGTQRGKKRYREAYREEQEKPYKKVQTAGSVMPKQERMVPLRRGLSHCSF